MLCPPHAPGIRDRPVKPGDDALRREKSSELSAYEGRPSETFKFLQESCAIRRPGQRKVVAARSAIGSVAAIVMAIMIASSS
jgi:hypothetical protein